jgi:hypothetical protein
MFRAQEDYIFGNNPDNEGPNALINAAQGYSIYLDWWSAVQNKDQKPVLLLLSVAQDDYTKRVKGFSNWQQGCVTRLAEMRSSIQ